MVFIDFHTEFHTELHTLNFTLCVYCITNMCTRCTCVLCVVCVCVCVCVWCVCVRCVPVRHTTTHSHAHTSSYLPPPTHQVTKTENVETLALAQMANVGGRGAVRTGGGRKRSSRSTRSGGTSTTVEVFAVKSSEQFGNVALAAWQQFENQKIAMNWPTSCEYFRPDGGEINANERDMSLAQLDVRVLLYDSSVFTHTSAHTLCYPIYLSRPFTHIHVHTYTRTHTHTHTHTHI